ncbi:hypothetical protein SAMN04488030_1959 [Aliiroseovarius halocynthiae]|uniref:Uncharacterized protein n=1 Tax=Aliiroseovarius halocynthiae TaxID=985055 RepID=A0A545SR96_9RHOB|nr:hypothetical protein FIL88_09665 [Aliiroseovarius halocynthiae]SMR81490.1 hypothetical protein SAMN04488030_1959 [Aliiroseovarius halocynthiae]
MIDQKLNEMGWTGTGLRFGAALLDPAAILASIATEGTAAPVIYSAKAGKLGRFLRAGTAGAAVNAGIEGYLVSQNPLQEWENVGFAAAAGFVLGGAVGAFGRTYDDIALSGAFEKALSAAEEVEAPLAARAAITGVPDGSVGAARVQPDVDLTAAEQVALDNYDAPKSAMGKARIDRVGILKQSDNGITRQVAGLLAEDGVGNANGTINVRSASEQTAREMRVRMARFYNVYNDEWNAWAKEQGLSWYQRGPASRAKFNNAVGSAVRRELDAGLDPHIQKVAATVKAEMKSLLEFGREKNIRGFNDIKDNYNYLTRKHRVEALDDLIERVGQGNVNQLMAKSLLSADEKWRVRNAGRAMATEALDYEDALNIGAAYVKSIRSRKYGHFDMNQALSGLDTEVLQEMLLDAGMGADEVARISDKVRFTRDTGEEGRMASAKMRLDLDETTTFDLRNADGTTSTIRIEDFLENDVEQLFTNYARSVLGAGFIEEALSHFKVAGKNGDMPQHAPSWETVKGYIAENSKLSQSAQATEFRRLDNLYKSVKGIAVEPPSNSREALRFLRDYNFIRIGGQLGVAQLAEIGNVLGQGGMKNMLQHMPALRGVFKGMRKGEFKDELFNEIEAVWGFGTDLTRHSPSVKMDDAHGSTFEGRNHSASKLQKADYALQQGKKVTSVASGMAHVNMVLQRMNSRVLVQRFMDNANGGRKINTKRLRVMGISDEMIERINGQLKAHVKEAQGLLGKKVAKINIDQWDDLDAKNTFINGVDRWAKKSVQENDIGNMPDFMSYEMYKTIAQFRSFMLAAYTKQLLSGLHHRDWETFSSYATSMLFGSLFYAAQQAVNAQGRADKGEWLEKRLAPEEIAKAGFQRAAFSSFIPMGVDEVVGFGGLDPVFSYRSRGLASGILGNPTYDLIVNLRKGASGVTSSILRSDYDFSQQDYRALTSTLFFQNAFVVRNVLNTIGGELPRFSH